jgi:hypothetical protein
VLKGSGVHSLLLKLISNLCSEKEEDESNIPNLFIKIIFEARFLG